MNNLLNIPSKIMVGYQNRGGTYTGKLAYVIYYDEKGKLRKEASWESWRDKKIEADAYENTPTAGFVLNKKVGGYRSDWNHRQTYARVYDPRGFEFEITVQNLLYILEHTDCIKGKGLDGNFVYAWSGTDLVLLPECAPEYKSGQEFTNAKSMKVSTKELVPGHLYTTKKLGKMIYVGKGTVPYKSWKCSKTISSHFFINQELTRFGIATPAELAKVDGPSGLDELPLLQHAIAERTKLPVLTKIELSDRCGTTLYSDGYVLIGDDIYSFERMRAYDLRYNRYDPNFKKDTSKIIAQKLSIVDGQLHFGDKEVFDITDDMKGGSLIEYYSNGYDTSMYSGYHFKFDVDMELLRNGQYV